MNSRRIIMVTLVVGALVFRIPSRCWATRNHPVGWIYRP